MKAGTDIGTDYYKASSTVFRSFQVSFWSNWRARAISAAKLSTTDKKCVRLSAFILASAASRSATLAGSCTASCVCALSNLIEPTARDPRASPRWRAPSARAIHCPDSAPPLRHPTATRTRIGAASSSCLAHHPIPTCPANAPARHDLLSVSPLLHPLSHVSSPSVPCPTGARHPARRPDALGQDDRRR
jgi:hypothetical protein